MYGLHEIIPTTSTVYIVVTIARSTGSADIVMSTEDQAAAHEYAQKNGLLVLAVMRSADYRPPRTAQ